MVLKSIVLPSLHPLIYISFVQIVQKQMGHNVYTVCGRAQWFSRGFCE